MDETNVILARMEVKLDNLLGLASDHEMRIRALENNGYVSGKQLWAGLTGVAVFAATLVPLIVTLTG